MHPPGIPAVSYTHLDVYKRQVLILNAAIEHPEEIIADLKERVVTFGLTEEADYSASDITYNEAACPSFTFLVRGQAAGHVTLNVPGRHNIANALAAIAFATEAGIDTDTIIRGLQAVSYTHLDVYKRQVHQERIGCPVGTSNPSSQLIQLG